MSNPGSERPVAIVVDSAASLPDRVTNSREIYVVPMNVTLGDKSYVDGCELPSNTFYRMMKASSVMPYTSAPSPDEFLKVFRCASDQAQSILCLTVGSKFSSTFNSANVAAKIIKESQKQLDIVIVDTKSAAGGEGLIALEALRATKQSKGLKEVESAVKKVMGQVKVLAFVDTLYYLWKGGRVSYLSHVGTSMLKIKPVFELFQGQIHSLARPRTQNNAMSCLFNLVRESVGRGRIHAVVMHADALNAAEELKVRIESEFVCEELFISQFSPVMGTHTGPGLVGIAFWSE